MARASRSRRTLTTLTLLSAAVLLSTTACSSDGDAGARQERPAPVRTAGSSPANETDAIGGTDEIDETDTSGGESVDLAPELDMADRVVLRQDGTRGNASLEFGKAKKGDGKAVTIGVRCEGKGKVEVVVRSMGTSFPLDCADGEVGSIYNQFEVDGANRGGVVSVTAPPEVRWSLSVGRGEPTGPVLGG
ncbi:hypothetical protein PV367_21560 [Streptomyces europaeiscabiei]|uniref:Lipoprotein n=1 Tax=Streptomyces europaeiscabiei TaxID=146819 RepID=A0AAJ2PS74_9ACTN|nr:hypothetical protein [Streptomyces europaeiscabiei]MDX3132323.1 hypothetical protein [Streptomyces europaeiscabiei]